MKVKKFVLRHPYNNVNISSILEKPIARFRSHPKLLGYKYANILYKDPELDIVRF